MSRGLLSISELRTKWHRENTFYEVREIGTGVQTFVKDVLKSLDVFALKVGLNSTKLENRKDEFLEEKKSKGWRRPDITIFITPEIIIPVEVEKYQNINAGKIQLLQYQIDLEKKYGILTDGYNWRFYNNNVYTQYTLKTIFEKTDIFLEFWREYIKPDKYYLAFFEEQGQLSLLKETERLHVEENRQIFFDDITELIDRFKRKLDIEGYLKDLPKKERSKTAVEITYAYIIQFILYKTLVDNEFDDFPKEYETLVRAIHRDLKKNSFKGILGVIDGISASISKNIYRPFAEEQRFIADTLLDLYHKPQNELHDVSPWLDVFVFIKKYNFAEVRNEIFGYIYENYLKARYEDQKKGQYFTDPAVVNFMLEEIGYNKEGIKKGIVSGKNKISLVDPACGSGTFLYSAVDTLIRTIDPDSEQLAKKVEELVNKNIFGLDIAEFPLYLAEMNILMRMLPLIINEKYNNPVEKKIKVFKTRDSMAEFMDTALRNTLHDIDLAAEKGKGQGFFEFKEELDLGYSSYVRDESDLKEMKNSLENRPRCPRRRFDFVIGNPPYVSYNQCCRQNVLIFDWLKKRELKLSNIYGVNLHSVPGNPKKYAPKPNLYVFFIALGLALLKDDGKLCYIVPQTILVNNDFDVIRYHLAKNTTIEKIITFSGKMFIGRGLKQNKPVPTSSLIFIVKRAKPSLKNNVEIINYKEANDEIEKCLENILKGKKSSRKIIMQNKLFQNVGNWNFIKQEREFLDFYDMYKIQTDNIFIYYDHAWAKQQFNNRFYFDGGAIINENLISNNDENSFEIIEKIDETRFLVDSSKKFYSKDGPFDFPHGSQGLPLFLQKYKTIWRTKNTQRFHYTERDVLLVKNKYLAISSNNKNEILYLLSILNSSVSQSIFENVIKVANEDTNTILLSLRAIKEQIRVPKIGENNQFVKDEIIKVTNDMLALEKIKLAHLVDFSRVMMQKFESVVVKGNSLILYKDKRERKLKIKSNKALVQKTIADKYGSDELQFELGNIILSELKSLPAIDFEKQTSLKDYIDDLVFTLYFNIPFAKVGLNHADNIKKVCQKNKFYQLLNKLS